VRRAAAAAAAVFLLAAGRPAAGHELEGRRAPGFGGAALTGGAVSLSALMEKGPVVLVFWSIYCKSCVDELQALERLAARHAPAGLSVVAVNEDGDVGEARVRAFLDRFAASEGRRIAFPVFFDRDGEVLRAYGVLHLPTLVYVDREGTVRAVIEGYERGAELAVASAIERLLESAQPEALREAAAEAVYDLDVAAPVCGVYRDGRWYRPLDLDESGRPEAVARARAQGEAYLRREAVRLALARLGYELYAEPRLPSCDVPYGVEIRTPRRGKDPLDLFMDRLDLARAMEVTAQETIERERDLLLVRRIRVHLPALVEQLEAGGYAAARTALRLRFVQGAFGDARVFLDALRSQFPYLVSVRRAPSPLGVEEYLLECHAAPAVAVEKLRTLDVGVRKLSVDVLPGGVAEVSLWR